MLVYYLNWQDCDKWWPINNLHLQFLCFDDLECSVTSFTEISSILRTTVRQHELPLPATKNSLPREHGDHLTLLAACDPLKVWSRAQEQHESWCYSWGKDLPLPGIESSWGELEKLNLNGLSFVDIGNSWSICGSYMIEIVLISVTVALLYT